MTEDLEDDPPTLRMPSPRRSNNPFEPQVDAAGLTHKGNARVNNEDQFLICRYGRFFEPLQSSLDLKVLSPPLRQQGCALIVADGLGGMAAGEVASQRAVSMLVELAVNTPDWIMRFEDEALYEEVMRRAKERWSKINDALVTQAAANPRLSGFGTTLTAAFSLGRDLFVAHLGDSRAYLLRDGYLRQLTRDHTLAQSLVEQGALSPENAAVSRLRHVLTACIGHQDREVEAEVRHLTVQDGDLLLVCSDGLTGELDDQIIREFLSTGDSAETNCHRLVARALQAGGHDNITAVVAKYNSNPARNVR